ncbi:MAG: RNAase, partial [Megasphaera elsdenii]|nr:RNAase [Megasphaera elsdenii]
ARNAYTLAPKSATVAEYHDSTALEALVGYLVMAGRQERLDTVMGQVYEETKAYCNEKHGGME